MIDNILVEGQAVYETGRLTVNFEREIEINISAQEARRQANQFVHLDISTQMRAMPPVLVVGQTIFWRVPIHLTLPAFGDVGCVGFLQVNPNSGQIDTHLTHIEEIRANAETLALRFSSPTAHPG